MISSLGRNWPKDAGAFQRTSTYTGELSSSAEGQMEWMTLDEMRKGGLAPHMEEYLRVLLEDDVPQAYGISGSGILEAIR